MERGYQTAREYRHHTMMEIDHSEAQIDTGLQVERKSAHSEEELDAYNEDLLESISPRKKPVGRFTISGARTSRGDHFGAGSLTERSSNIGM